MNGFCQHFCVRIQRFGHFTDPAIYSKRGIWGWSIRKLLRPTVHLSRYLGVVLCKILLHEDTIIGTGVRFSKKGNIIIGAKKIGNDCVIHHNVTIGMHLAGNKSFAGTPSIGDRVWIGPETIIHGNIRIGDGATILGESVLTKNVPPCCIVGGNPARILGREFNNSRLLCSCRYEVNQQTIQEWATVDV